MTSADPPEVGLRSPLLGREIHFRAVDENHDVGVLLDGPRFAEVRKHRARFAPRFLRGAAELGDADDGNGQLLGQFLERTGDEGHFLVAVLEPPAGAHQLDVVDEDDVQRSLQLQPPGLGLHFRQGQGRRFVEKNPAGRERFGAQPEPVEVPVADACPSGRSECRSSRRRTASG